MSEFVTDLQSGKGIYKLAQPEDSFKAIACLRTLLDELELKKGDDSPAEQILLEWLQKEITDPNSKETFIPVIVLSQWMLGVLLAFMKDFVATPGYVWKYKVDKKVFSSIEQYQKAMPMQKMEHLLPAVGDMLHFFLMAPITITTPLFKKDERGSENMIQTFAQEGKKDAREETLLQIRGREFHLCYSKLKWHLLYNTYPFESSPLPITEMAYPIICSYCNEEITDFETEGKRLFISRGCIYRHKYHAACAKKFLNTESTSLEKYIQGWKNFYSPHASCYNCGCPLSVKDLKELFQQEFKKHLIKESEQDYYPSFLPSKECKGIEGKRLSPSFAKAQFDVISPFEKGRIENKPTLIMRDCKFCGDNQKVHKCDYDEICKLYKGVFSKEFLLFCGGCGKSMKEDGRKYPLSCRHNFCACCAKEWIYFADSTKSYYTKFYGKESENVFWPQAFCHFCKTRQDLVTICIHGDHYISLPHLLRQFFLQPQGELRCLEKGCSEIKNCFGNLSTAVKYLSKIFETAESDRVLPNSLLLVQEVNPALAKDHNLKRWLKHRYAIITEHNNKVFLVGYKGQFRFALEDLKKWNKKIDPKIAAEEKEDELDKYFKILEQSLKEFSIRTDINCVFSTNIPASTIETFVALGEFTKGCYIDASIYGAINGYEIDKRIYFMSANGIDTTALEKGEFKLDDILMIAGPYGRGFYMSEDPMDIHRISTNRLGKYFMLAVCSLDAKMREKRLVHPDDFFRVAGDLQKVELKESTVAKEFQTNATGIMRGNLMYINKKQDNPKKESMKSGHSSIVSQMKIVYDPAMIIPFFVISYSINLEEF